MRRLRSRTGRDHSGFRSDRSDLSYDVYVWPEGQGVQGIVETIGREFVLSFRSRGQRGWRARMREKLARHLHTHPSAISFWLRDDLLVEKDRSS